MYITYYYLYNSFKVSHRFVFTTWTRKVHPLAGGFVQIQIIRYIFRKDSISCTIHISSHVSLWIRPAFFERWMIYITRKHIRNNDVYMRYPTCIALQLRQFFGGEKKETCMESYLLQLHLLLFYCLSIALGCIAYSLMLRMLRNMSFHWSCCQGKQTIRVVFNSKQGANAATVIVVWVGHSLLECNQCN